MSDQDVCGVLSGFGGVAQYGCQHPKGHSGLHRNANCFEWSDSVSDQDRPIFSDGLITPFIDAAQQQGHDRGEETIDGRRLATWADIKRLGQTVNELMAENENLTAEVTRLTQERDTLRERVDVAKRIADTLQGGWIRQERTIYELAQEHERLKVAILTPCEVHGVSSRICERGTQCCTVVHDPSAEGRKPRP